MTVRHQSETEQRRGPGLLADLLAAWRSLSRVEAVVAGAFAVALVVVAVAGPGGVLGGFVTAIGLGLLAGIAIGIGRQRR